MLFETFRTIASQHLLLKVYGIKNVIMRTSKPTVHDVARLAGVAISTVSAAFNDGPVSNETRLKVLEAAKMLGYVRNGLARSMVTKKSYMLGLVLPWNNVEIIDSAVRRAHETGYGLMTLFSDGVTGASETELIQRMVERMVDGIIFAPKMDAGTNYSEIFSMVKAAKVEMVLVDRHFMDIQSDSFVSDDRAGAAQAVNHLASLGHRKIVFLSNFDDSSAMRERRDGTFDAARRMGIECDPETAVRVSNTDESFDVLKKIFTSSKRKATAIFAATDHVAYDAIIACGRLGLRIPEDISIVGYGDLLIGPHRIGELLSPPLTAVRQNFALIATMAVDRIREKLSSGYEKNGIKSVKIETELVVRKSSASPKKFDR
jgi:LacI family transcriptional regulator